MQGKHTYEAICRRFYFVSTGKVAVYAHFVDGSRRLHSVVDGERLVSLPGGCTSIECVPDRKVEYEAVAWKSATLREIPDPTPVAVGIPLERPLTLQEEIKRFIRDEIAETASAHGAGSWEDEDDFDVDEDPDLASRYEMDEMQEEALASDYDPDRETDPEGASSDAPAEAPAPIAEDTEDTPDPASASS